MPYLPDVVVVLGARISAGRRAWQLPDDGTLALQVVFRCTLYSAPKTMTPRQQLDAWSACPTGPLPYGAVFSYAFGIARRCFDDAADAEDVAGHVRLKLWIRESAGNLPTALGVWVRRRTLWKVYDILRRRGLGEVRGRGSSQDDPDDDVVQHHDPIAAAEDRWDEGPVDESVFMELRRHLAECLMRLTERQRQCWTLWWQNSLEDEPLTQDELAHHVRPPDGGITRKAFMDSVNAANDKMQLCLASKGHGPSKSSPQSNPPGRRP